MEIDHLFIFSNNEGSEADQLLKFGLTEGSSRRHPGQGTRNRKFYFENFFLEVLGVVDQKEIQSELTANTRLWERSQFESNDYSPFGLCLDNSESSDPLFLQSQVYQPSYFPKGMSINFITNSNRPELPWTFRLPYRDQKNVHQEPTVHANGIKKLTSTRFEYSAEEEANAFTKHFEDLDNIAFIKGDRNHLNLEFDYCRQQKRALFEDLSLTIHY